jgi:hypothetical protein
VSVFEATLLCKNQFSKIKGIRWMICFSAPTTLQIDFFRKGLIKFCIPIVLDVSSWTCFQKRENSEGTIKRTLKRGGLLYICREVLIDEFTIRINFISARSKNIIANCNGKE